MACVSGLPKGFGFDGNDMGCFLSVELGICSTPDRSARLRPRIPEHRKTRSVHGSQGLCTAAALRSAECKRFYS